MYLRRSKNYLLLILFGILPAVVIAQNNRPQTSSNVLSEDIKRFLVNFNQSFKEAKDLKNRYQLTRVLMQDQIRDLKAIDPVNKAKIVQIETRLKTLKRQEKVAKKNVQKFEKYWSSLTQIRSLRLDQQNKLVTKVESGFQKMPRVFEPPRIAPLNPSERATVVANTKQANNTTDNSRNNGRNEAVTSNSSAIASYSRSKDVMYTPPASECKYAFKGKDEFLGKEKIEVVHDLLFFHTEPSLRPYLKGKEYIECHAGLSTSSGGLTTLNIEVKIRSQNAQREFGGLQKGTAITFKLVNGEIVKLASISSDLGLFDESTGITTFRNQYLIQKGEESAFLTSEIDKIRVVWTNGYEDYNVFNVDFMMKQINCLYAD